MRISCTPNLSKFPVPRDTIEILLYSMSHQNAGGYSGHLIKEEFHRRNWEAHPRAWDLLSLALAVTAADLAGHRDKSPDGWTRELAIDVAAFAPTAWNVETNLIERMLGFLTTDRWAVSFSGNGYIPRKSRRPHILDRDSVLLLSGGLDSLIGGIDLVSNGHQPLAVSQIVRGDRERQEQFARDIGNLPHLPLSHATKVPDPETPPSQRSRSFLFISYGVLAATTLRRYKAGASVPLYVCENGFISVNPPLTALRVGSLSTRTTHPHFLGCFQDLLDAMGLNVRIENPYQFRTKGEMMIECLSPGLLQKLASSSTSCGRFKQFGYKHCGRCVPCLVRRGAFYVSGIPDGTHYVHENLGIRDSQHSGFDDVRAAAMAVEQVHREGLESWLGASLSTSQLGDVTPFEQTVHRGLAEIDAILKHYGVA